MAGIYHYDALDQLVGTQSADTAAQRFYCKSRLSTELQEPGHTVIFQHGNQPLAERRAELSTELLVTDQQCSVLAAVAPQSMRSIAYAPFGQHVPGGGLGSLLGFNGERPEPLTGHYLLGKGYRSFMPNLMRFNSPDSLSPFDKGGVNSYGYCQGDPINRQDPSGHWSFSQLFKVFRLGKVKAPKMPASAAAQSDGLRPLVNHYSKLAKAENAAFKSKHLSQGSDPRRIIQRPADLTSGLTGTPQKFVVSDKGQMATVVSGEKGTGQYISHATLAKALHSKRIVSAGTLYTGSMGEVFVNNVSGHYLPSVAHLQPAVKRLRELGFDPAVLDMFSLT